MPTPGGRSGGVETDGKRKAMGGDAAGAAAHVFFPIGANIITAARASPASYLCGEISAAPASISGMSKSPAICWPETSKSANHRARSPNRNESSSTIGAIEPAPVSARQPRRREAAAAAWWRGIRASSRAICTCVAWRSSYAISPPSGAGALNKKRRLYFCSFELSSAR